jgi:hypothetical protein
MYKIDLRKVVIFLSHPYYSVQYICPLEKKWDISHGHRDISHGHIGIKLDLCFCIIPTVGLYGKLGEVTATHN